MTSPAGPVVSPRARHGTGRQVDSSPAAGPPAGLVGMLFTDIEGSTALARALGKEWAGVQALHHAVLRSAITGAGGWIDSSAGDAFFATFADPGAAAAAAVSAQHGLAAAPWPDGTRLKVRMGLHVGAVERSSTGYVGLEIHRAARVAAAAHGGQVLVTREARTWLPASAEVDDLGMHRLKDFPAPQQLFHLVVHGRHADAFPPPRTLRTRPTNLPPGRPALVGRQDDVAAVVALLRRGHRLVTLTGRGGVGKTSLALAAATQLLDEHPGGVWLVPLAAQPRAEQVLTEVARCVHADTTASRNPLDALHDRFSGVPALLVLDNLEHLLPCADDLEALLDTVADVAVLATSQLPLATPSETAVPVDPLPVGDAVELFAERGRRACPGLRLVGDERAAAAEVCRRLDGIPLAVELAAARLSVLSPTQISSRLARPLDLLQDRDHAGPQRHRSLRATVDWTLALLDEGPRELFPILGAFAAPPSLQDLEVVLGADASDPLEALLDVALARQVIEDDGRLRFTLPEALRQAAAERLAASPAHDTVRHRHARRIRDLLHAARLFISAPADVYPAALRVDADADAALAWTRTRDPALADAIAAAWAFRLSYEGHTRHAVALLDAIPAGRPTDPVVSALVHAAHGVLRGGRGDLPGCLRHFDQAIRDAREDDPEFGCVLLVSRGNWYAFYGQPERGLVDCQQARDDATRYGSELQAGITMATFQVQLVAGRLDEALATVADAERLMALAPCWAGDGIHTNRADLALALGDWRNALRHNAESLARSERQRNDGQFLQDLAGIYRSLAVGGQLESAAETLCLLQAHTREAYGPEGVIPGLTREERQQIERLGPEALHQAQKHAAAVPPGERGNHVRRLLAAALAA